jgi:hypothetical protein
MRMFTFTPERELWLMAEFGVTAALDMATWPHSKLSALRDRVGMTDFQSPGLPATSPEASYTICLGFSLPSLPCFPN